MDSASYYVNQSIKLLKDIINKYPENKEDKIGLAYSYSSLGDIKIKQANFQEAINCYKDQNIILNELYKNNSFNTPVKKQLLDSYESLGKASMSLRLYEVALLYYKEHNKLSIEFYNSDSTNSYFKQILALSYFNLGKVSVDLNYKDNALSCINKSVEIYSGFYKTDKANIKINKNLLTSLRQLSQILLSYNHLEKALDIYKKYNLVSEELYRINPQDSLLKYDLSISNYYLGDINYRLNDFTIALQYYKRCNLITKEIYKKDSTFKSEFAQSYIRLGETYLQLKLYENALISFNDSKRLYNELLESDSKNDRYRESLAISLFELAKIKSINKDFKDALLCIERAIYLINEIINLYPDNDYLLNILYNSYVQMSFICNKLSSQSSDSKEIQEKEKNANDNISNLVSKKIIKLEFNIDSSKNITEKLPLQKELIQLRKQRWEADKSNDIEKAYYIQTLEDLLEIAAFAREFGLVQSTTQEIISLDNTRSKNQVWLAIAYLFQGNFKQAKKICQDWKGQIIDNQPFRKILSTTLDKLAQENITHPDTQKLIDIVSN